MEVPALLAPARVLCFYLKKEGGTVLPPLLKSRINYEISFATAF